MQNICGIRMRNPAEDRLGNVDELITKRPHMRRLTTSLLSEFLEEIMLVADIGQCGGWR